MCLGDDSIMRTTLTLDEDLLKEAQKLTGTTEKTALVRQALTALIERESARRLARLGGSQPDLVEVPRRRSNPA
jgi:Arc/MetJ family transcription regulator